MTPESNTLLIKNIDTLVTMDDERRVLENGWILVEGNTIHSLGGGTTPPPTAEKTLDASGRIVLPGLVNTHHHFMQTLLRAMPTFQNKTLWYWLIDLYEPMGSFTDEMADSATRIALAELALSGCTTAQDHSYVWVNDMTCETQINAALEMGVRFHLSRGSMSQGKSQGAITPDDMIEDEEDILAGSEHLVRNFHDFSPNAMTRIEIAPCSLFSVSTKLLRESAELARRLGVAMHTHCYESQEEEDFCVKTYGKRPVYFAADNGWAGPDTYYAHAVRHNAEEVAFMGEMGTGVAHCPSSNSRLASGIAPVKDYLAHGVRVGLAVDGSASNDSSHMLGEARIALLMQRIRYGADGFSATEALEIATLGGAKVLCRDDIGVLKPGMAADFVGFDINQLSMTGSLHDPVGALVFCQPSQVDFSIINGKVVVEDGQINGVDLPGLIANHNRLSNELVQATEKRYNHDLSTRIWRRAYQ
jgi:8-oxoguanine deaminase